MALDDFITQLRELGYDPAVGPKNFVSFNYEILIGPLRGKQIGLGFQDPSQFPLNPPGGPCVSPRLLPLRGGSAPPLEGVHAIDPAVDPSGEWEYWSRPFHGWDKTSRRVTDYLAHVNTLFDRLPDDV
ncbi:MAG: hypothetical protein CVT66_10600 [Actinobacteria bacterium HGW-Actinobacteria-6]|jgi:hypothetical protein|nr:MAG: hypothetical protein CVT66_10600 [Actinobacteria bacterium HGW-Actinobacteria-6]